MPSSTRSNSQSNDTACTFRTSESLGESVVSAPCVEPDRSSLANPLEAADLPPPHDRTAYQPQATADAPSSVLSSVVEAGLYPPNFPQEGLVNNVRDWNQQCFEAQQEDKPGLAKGFKHLVSNHIGLQLLMNGVSPPADLPPPHLIDNKEYKKKMGIISQKREAEIMKSHEALAASLSCDEPPHKGEAFQKDRQGTIEYKYNQGKVAILSEALHLGNPTLKPGRPQSLHRQTSHVAPSIPRGSAPHAQSNQDASEAVPHLAGSHGRSLVAEATGFIKGSPYLVVPGVVKGEVRMADENVTKFVTKERESREQRGLTDGPGHATGAYGVAYYRPSRDPSRSPSRYPTGSKSEDYTKQLFAIWGAGATPEPKPKEDQLLAREQLLAPDVSPDPS